MITEDTPEADSAEMWQWLHDQLRERYDALVINHGNLQAGHTYLHRRISELTAQVERLTDGMTIAQLRNAGFTVHVEE
jgi:predicted subunit of tRNA(5-methylaminomethyl-2-thiouridylate) methyltransferase